MFENKLVAVMNKQVEPGAAMNALAHMCIGFGGNIGGEEIHLMDYIDADKNVYPNISKMPFIVLRAKNSNKLRELLERAKEMGIRYSVFTNTMTEGTWEDQQKRTEETKKDDLVFYGIVLFGKKETVSDLTKKFSLWN